MRKILIIMLLSVLVFASYNTKKETEVNEEKTPINTTKSREEKKATIDASPSESSHNINDNKELILYHKICEEVKYSDKSMYDAICFYTVSDSNRNEAIITSYIQEKDMYKEKPDGEIDHKNQKLGEYYINEEKGKISFILHMEGAICCLTVNMSDFDKEGYIACEYDENQNIVKENLLSNDGSILANIAYEYMSNIPFPIITEYKALENNGSIQKMLNRNQKLWLYKDYIEFSDLGKIIGYKGDIFNLDDNNDYLAFNYNDTDIITNITGKLTNDDYFNEIENDDFLSSPVNIDFCYKNKLLESFSYNRPSTFYGTTDSTGEVLYDDKGRMVYNEYYITHGSVYCFYFYKNNEKRPWASVTFDSMAYSGWEENGIEYMHGNEISTYIFQKE